MSKNCKVCREPFDGPYLRCEDCLAKQRERSRRYKRSARGVATRRSYAETKKARELSRAAQKRHREKDPEGHRARNREKARRLYAQSPEKYRRRAQEYAKANPEKRRENEARRRARKAGVPVGARITPELLEGKLAMYHGRCWICRTAPWGVWDHVKPLSRGGAHILANLRPACGPCNQSKYNEWPYRRPEEES